MGEMFDKTTASGWPLIAPLLALVLLVALVGCSSSASRAGDSPIADLSAATVQTGSDFTEGSQFVEVRIPFDRDITADDGAASDLTVTLDGNAPDSKTTEVSVTSSGKNLVVRLTPTANAEGVQSGSYFACYQAQLAISSRDGNGTLGHVTGPDGSAAVLEGELDLKIPSGMRVKTTGSTKGTTTVEVTRTAQLRCCTWFRVGSETFYQHHHLFEQETKASEAASLAESVNENLAGKYRAKAKGARVTIRGLGANAKRKFDVKILEGVGA